MKFVLIKTSTDGFINAARVKHFYINDIAYGDAPDYSYHVMADGVSLAYFPYEHNDDKSRNEARAKAVAWLAELITNFSSAAKLEE